jgi:hypothetical protein
MASKRLSVSQLKDEVSMYDEFIEITVPIQGEEYTVKMFPYFKPEKVRDLVNELIEFFKASDKEKLEIPEIEEDDLIGYFIIKYFTDMKFTTSKKAKKIYEEFKLALNSDLFKVLMKTYPEESVKKVLDRIYEVRETDAKLKAKIEKAQDAIVNLPLENREIFEKINLQ